MSRRTVLTRVAVLFAVPVLLAGCGSDDDTAAAPSASTAPSTAVQTTAAEPTPTPAPTDSATAAQQWFETGGQAAQDVLSEATKLGLTEPLDPTALAGRCTQLVTATQAAQALPPFPVPGVQAELANSYTGLLDVAARCSSDAAAGVTSPLRSGLTAAVFTAVSAYQIALTDAGLAQLPS